MKKKKQDLLDKLTNIYGIGEKKGEELIDKGIKSIENLEKRQNELQENKLPLLNDKQKIGLKYYKPLLERIPRDEIDKYKILLDKIIKEIIEENKIQTDDIRYEIVGSYRRKKQDSGDIDIIISSESNDRSIYKKFVKKLQDNKIIIELLSNGNIKSYGISKLPDDSKINYTPRRIDIMYSPPNEYAFAILYFTGSKEFNTAMRQNALTNNLTLNEHEFHIIKDKKKEEKLDKTFKTEKDIFDYLNLEFKEPHERIDGDSVIVKNTKEPEKEPEKVEKVEKEPEKVEKEVKKVEKEVIEKKVEKEVIEKKVEKEVIEKKVEKKETLKIKSLKDVKSKIKTLKNTEKKKTLEDIENFKKKGITSLKELTKDELDNILNLAINDYGIIGEEILTDNEFDIISNYVLVKYNDNLAAKYQHTQIKLNENKVKLPYEMWSMDKIKPDTKALDNYKKEFKGPYIISNKLDGVSALYSTENDKP
jgi:DNA polymerase/3'-5' exonuclease PolX